MAGGLMTCMVTSVNGAVTNTSMTYRVGRIHSLAMDRYELSVEVAVGSIILPIAGQRSATGVVLTSGATTLDSGFRSSPSG